MMETYIYTLMREMQIVTILVPNAVHDELCNLGITEESLTNLDAVGEETTALLLAAIKGKGGKKGGGKEGSPNPNGYGKGLCFECGKLGHYASNCLSKGNTDNNPKGGNGETGGCKGGKGGKNGRIGSIDDVFAQINLMILDGANIGASIGFLGWLGKPTCCITNCCGQTHPSFDEVSAERSLDNRCS